MKYIFSLIVLSLMAFHPLDDIYSITIKNIDGSKIELNQFRGKKLLFIVLPLSTQDTTVTVSEINQIQSKYQGSLVVIGIPAEETGFKKGDEANFKKLYRDAGANFIIAEGMKVKKGSEQSSLFQWLTDKDKNRHFNQDVQGVGSKFFIDEGGELYAVMGPALKLTHPVIDKILSKQFKH